MEDSVFKRLLEDSVSLEQLIDSLNNNIQAINDYFYDSFSKQVSTIEDVERFILFKHSLISQLDFSDVQNRSFILILLDLCERHALYSCVPHLDLITQSNGINLSNRLKAGLKLILPEPKTNSELVDRYDDICCLLQAAYDEEEDNELRVQMTLLNYVDHVLYNTNQIYADSLLSRISYSKENDQYSFLKSINGFDLIPRNNPGAAHLFIENLIDKLSLSNYQSSLQINSDCLIESDTDYCDNIKTLPSDFLSIRKYCAKHASGRLEGRGVKKLETESEMYEYMKRFGKMHYAKIMSAFEDNFPQQFDSRIDLVDWGCGQALASMSFIEKYGAECLSKIILVEPSEIVLRRAALHCRKFAPNTLIITICKTLDEVETCDLPINKFTPTVHLFSNILDIDDYTPNKLQRILDEATSCADYYVCASPYIDDIKSARIESFMNHFANKEGFVLYHDVENTKYNGYWLCNNQFGTNGDYCHGLWQSCRSTDGDIGCLNKWTRVLKVFSVL